MTRGVVSTDDATVVENRRGADYSLAVDGPCGLEAVIDFDGVEIDGHTFHFLIESQQSQGVVSRKSGQLEADVDALGEVGAWLQGLSEEWP